MGDLLLVSSVQKTSHSHLFLVWGEKCRLLATNNECTSSEIKGLEKGEGAITSFHGLLFPSRDRGDSKLALLQDLGGKICRTTTTANSTLGNVPVVFLSERPFALKRFPQRHCPSMLCQEEGRGLLSASWSPTEEAEASCLVQPGAQQARSNCKQDGIDQLSGHFILVE